MNHLVRLLVSQGSLPRKRVLATALLSGLSGASVLAIVNVAARKIAESGQAHVDWLLAVGFVVCILAYGVSEVFLVSRVCAAIEGLIHEIRARLLERLVRADFEKVERVGRAVFYESITQATQVISQNSQFLALALRASVMVVAIFGYIGFVSFIAFVLVALATVIGGFIFRRAGQRLALGFDSMMNEERRLFEGLDDLLDGFKEVRLSSARSGDLDGAFSTISHSVTEIRTDVQILAIQQFLLGQVVLYFLLATVVFVVPLYSDDFRAHVVQVTTSVLFMTGALGGLIQTMPMLTASEQAAERMLQLDASLKTMEEPGEAEGASPLASFGEITLRAVSYAYPAPDGEKAFALGPVDLSLRRGEIVFVTGGNGSGKSTLIKLLTGLIPPQAGTIQIDGVPLGPRTRHAFRDLISTVFSDFHLFPRLYGAAPQAMADAQSLLAWFEIDGVTRLKGDRFEHLDLSAGQRKRLALIAALLEARPLLVLDEWAADQDPYFRRKFYREILPELKARGITTVAVTHDDAYFDVADRRFRLDEGRLTEYTHAQGETG